MKFLIKKGPINHYITAIGTGVLWQLVGFGSLAGFLMRGYDLTDWPMGLPMTLLLWLPFFALEIPCADRGKKWRHAAIFGTVLLLLSPVILRIYFVLHLFLAGFVALAFVVPYGVCFLLYFLWISRKESEVWEFRVQTSLFLCVMAMVVLLGFIGLLEVMETLAETVAEAGWGGPVVLMVMAFLQVFMLYMGMVGVLTFSDIVIRKKRA
ncbi:MAG: hypothetical protein Q4D98_02915 [Planctomycetia bacterium]|nr:hypothetical protein [Planctomycetia bacterium]